ncbi:hypothetical protein QVD17_39804 [Tagetes erecta]|uniref:F-box domain-containing protein n=1 Tax=Tagetes erecta TaxID=13708 RepID=A0AAD8NFN4_TARER|nr:hypothetical protein QVD17_39804 [Tagetes erecta]
MKTLKQERSAFSFPIEIIENILPGLPVKSLLRFRSVSKQWLSIISNNPSFTKLHFTRAIFNHHTRLFISACDPSTRKRYLFSASHDGGPVTLIKTLVSAYCVRGTKSEHLNGLVCFSCVPWIFDSYDHPRAYVLNPSTLQTFTINTFDCHVFHLFGFDESTNDHKVLMFSKPFFDIYIFSMSSYSWRKIRVDPPIGFNWDDLQYYNTELSVCVNSVIHLLLDDPLGILAFDLRTYKFSIISTPQGLMSLQTRKLHGKLNRPWITKINGCVGVFWYQRVEESNQLCIWILQDYETRVWVEEIIIFPESWIGSDNSFPDSFDVNKDEFIFVTSKVSGNVVNVPMYNIKTKCFKSLQFTFTDQFPFSKTLKFDHIKCYVDSMLSVRGKKQHQKKIA